MERRALTKPLFNCMLLLSFHGVSMRSCVGMGLCLSTCACGCVLRVYNVLAGSEVEICRAVALSGGGGSGGAGRVPMSPCATIYRESRIRFRFR